MKPADRPRASPCMFFIFWKFFPRRACALRDLVDRGIEGGGHTTEEQLRAVSHNGTESVPKPDKRASSIRRGQ
jgi:hypothetical protein